jgi:hypothetical protein
MPQHARLNTLAGVVSTLVFALTLSVPIPARAQIVVATPTEPTDGAVDVDLLRLIEWTPVANAQAYYLYIGSSPGAKDYLDSGEIQQPRYPALGVPSGVRVHARLWTKSADVWRYVDFSFTTSSASSFGFVYPPASQAEADMTRPFEWTVVPNADAYYLYVGSAPGLKDYVNTGEIHETSFLAFNLPTGVQLYARIWAKLAGQWRYVDQTFTATAAARQLATFVHPTNGEVNANLTLPIQWTSAANAQAYYLYVGTTPGGTDLINTGETLLTSYRSPTLPAGRAIYARLWTKTWNVWRSVDISFTVDAAAAGTPGAATFVYPTNGAANVDITRQIQWTSVPNAQAYYLYVGTAPGLKDLINSGELQWTTYPAWSLPPTGTLYARIYTKSFGSWRSSDISFTAAAMNARLTAPPDGATTVDPTQVFTWTTVPSKQAYYLYVGSAPGLHDLIDSEETQQTSWSGLNGGKSQGLGQVWNSRKLYVRLWTKLGGVWKYADTTFTTQVLAATFVYPADGSTGVDFSWTSVPNAQKYRLTIDRVIGNGKIDTLVDTGEITATSYDVGNLPQSGDLHGRIWTKVNDVWRYTDITFTLKAQLVSLAMLARTNVGFTRQLPAGR